MAYRRNGFAESGLGEGATGAPSDTDPTPSFHSPYADNATVTLRPIAGSSGAVVTLYIGDYEARVTPVADTDPATPLPDTFQILPDTQFDFLVNGKGWGSQKFTASFTTLTRSTMRPRYRLGIARRCGRQAGHHRPGRRPTGQTSSRSMSAPCCGPRSAATSTPVPRTGSAHCGRSRSWRATPRTRTAQRTPATRRCTAAPPTRSPVEPSARWRRN